MHITPLIGRVGGGQLKESSMYKAIAGYEEMYWVDQTGSVISLRRDKTIELIPSTTERGYRSVGLTKEGKQTSFRVHRLVATHFLANPKELPKVGHIDEDRDNNHVSNLRWCTNKDNSTWFANTNPTAVNGGTAGKAIQVDGVTYPSCYQAAQFIASCNVGTNYKTISKELRRILSGHRKSLKMYTHTISFPI